MFGKLHWWLVAYKPSERNGSRRPDWWLALAHHQLGPGSLWEAADVQPTTSSFVVPEVLQGWGADWSGAARTPVSEAFPH